MPSYKGIKEKCLLGDNPIFLPTVFVCSHDYATVVIMFYSFCFNKVPSKAFGIVWMIVDLILCKKHKLLLPVQKFLKFTGMWFWSEVFTHDWYKNSLRCPNFSEFLKLQKSGGCSDHYRLFCFWQILFAMHSLLVLWFRRLILLNINCENYRVR